MGRELGGDESTQLAQRRRDGPPGLDPWQRCLLHVERDDAFGEKPMVLAQQEDLNTLESRFIALRTVDVWTDYREIQSS